MAINPYDPCPCGSGKKFKWCCVTYWDKVEQSFAMQEKGQHEGSMKVMESLTREHPNVPQVWVYYANLLLTVDKSDLADQALEKALEVQPNFPMALMMRGMIRQTEGSTLGALMLYYKAAEHYPEEATHALADLWETIARNELNLNRTLACRAAMELACHYDPEDTEHRRRLEEFFGSKSKAPNFLKTRLDYRPTARPHGVQFTDRLNTAIATFESLTQQVPTDPAAWFNLAVARYRRCNDEGALEALDKSLELEFNDDHAEETALLREAFCTATTTLAQSDYVQHRGVFEIRDGNTFMQFLRNLDAQGRLIMPQQSTDDSGFSMMIVEDVPSLLDSGTTLMRIVGNLIVTQGIAVIIGLELTKLQELFTEFRDQLQLAISDVSIEENAAHYSDIAMPSLCLPKQVANAEEAARKALDYTTNYYETRWLHLPFKRLGGLTPLDAAQVPTHRKSLLGLVRFQEECYHSIAGPKTTANPDENSNYDFSNLRHKLNLSKTSGASIPAELAAEAKLNFAAMNTPELAALKPELLSAADLEEAMKAALKLDARELAAHFAKAGVAKPADPTKPDRYTMYLALMSAALSEGQTEQAFAHIRAGADYDRQHNDGKRANEYGLRLAQLLAKSGDQPGAIAEFNQLIERNPEEGKYIVTATEVMLSARNAAQATAFAERGLQLAQSQGNRDLEAACRELHDAAKRLG